MTNVLKLAHETLAQPVLGTNAVTLARAVISQDEELRRAEVVLQSQMAVRDGEIAALRAGLKRALEFAEQADVATAAGELHDLWELVE